MPANLTEFFIAWVRLGAVVSTVAVFFLLRGFYGDKREHADFWVLVCMWLAGLILWPLYVVVLVLDFLAWLCDF